MATSAETAQADPSQADPRSPPRYGSPEWWRLRIAAYVAEDAKHRTAADHAPAAASKAAPAAARAPLRRPQPIPDGWRPDADGIAYARAAGLSDARIAEQSREACTFVAPRGSGV